MKKWMALLLVPALLAPALGAAEKFSLRISYGAARIGPSDLNNFLADFVHIRREMSYTMPAAGLKPVDWSDEFELSLSVALDDQVALIASAGFIGARQVGNDIDFTMLNGSGTFRRNDRIRAFAARLGISYALPLFRALILRPHASVDGYWSSFRDDGSQSYSWSNSPQLEWIADTTAFNIGWTLGLSLDFAIWSKLSLTLDAGWRQVRLSGFTGKFQETDFGVAAASQNFRLFYFELQNWPAGIYRFLNLPGTFGASEARVLRDAVLDLSGFYGSAGIKISF
jgi:hypothetical protein